MSANIKIAIAEPSEIIRCGLVTLLKRLPGLRIQLTEIATAECLIEGLRMHRPEILIINPYLPGYFGLQHLKDECGCPNMKCLALTYMLADHAQIRAYDDLVNIYDSSDELKHKLERLNTEEISAEVEEEQQSLSSREKEIVICVVRGMTNREIADRLYLSTHTVITHRRNIARKLQVHSASGLTVYAIVNKLIELNDIKNIFTK